MRRALCALWLVSCNAEQAHTLELGVVHPLPELPASGSVFEASESVFVHAPQVRYVPASAPTVVAFRRPDELLARTGLDKLFGIAKPKQPFGNVMPALTHWGMPADDVDSLERTCSPPGVSPTCTPGCTHPRHSAGRGSGGRSHVVWCSSTRREAVDDEWPCAWRPTDTRSMLVQREALREAEPWFKPFHKRFDDHKFYVEMICASPWLASTLEPLTSSLPLP